MMSWGWLRNIVRRQKGEGFVTQDGLCFIVQQDGDNILTQGA